MKLLYIIILALVLSGCNKESRMIDKYEAKTGRENITLECYGYTLYYRGDGFFHELAYDENGNLIDCNY